MSNAKNLMKITAYQDPESGQVFLSEHLLNEFVEKRNQEALTFRQLAQAKEKQQQKDIEFVASLVSPSAAHSAIQARYEEALKNRKPQKDAAPLHIEEVSVHSWRIKEIPGGKIGLSFGMRVEFTAPTQSALENLDDGSTGLAPKKVLPYTDNICYQVETGDKVFSAVMQYELKRIPELLLRLRELADLSIKSTQYGIALHEATILALKSDTAYSRALTDVQQAIEALEAAKAVLNTAEIALSRRKEEVQEKIAQKQPFVERNRFKELLDELEVQDRFDLLSPSTLNNVTKLAT